MAGHGSRGPVGWETAAHAAVPGVEVRIPRRAIAYPSRFEAAGGLQLRDPWIWLSAPLAYLFEFVIVLASGGSLGAGGAATGPGGHASRAPYPFLDVDSLGIPHVALNVTLLAAAILLLGYLAVLADHLLARRGRTTRYSTR